MVFSMKIPFPCIGWPNKTVCTTRQCLVSENYLNSIQLNCNGNLLENFCGFYRLNVNMWPSIKCKFLLFNLWTFPAKTKSELWKRMLLITADQLKLVALRFEFIVQAFDFELILLTITWFYARNTSGRSLPDEKKYPESMDYNHFNNIICRMNSMSRSHNININIVIQFLHV